MHNSISTFTTPLLVLVILSVVFILPARADSYGNDDQEFDVGSSLSPTYVSLTETFIYPMTWSSSPPYNSISMQYNPDKVISSLYQTDGDWFQTGIISDASGCPDFTIQVYTIDGEPYWRSDQGFNCSQSYLQGGATWTIREEGFHNSQGLNRIIGDVYFSVSTPTSSSSYTLFPPGPYWSWLRSNLCWCGTDGGSTTFTNGYGVSTVSSDANVNSIGSPVIVSTAENSNMPYQSFYSSGTQNMAQGFGWCDCSGGGGGGGSVAVGTLITLADGRTVPVQDLTTGMQLLSYNMTDDQFVDSTITRFVTVTVHNEMMIETSDGRSLTTDQNPAQRLYVMLPNGTWTLLPVTQLKVGYGLFDPIADKWVPIIHIQYVDAGSYTMYDVYTTAPGNYIANSYLDPLKN
jgi:hypothetical protein